MSRYSKLRPTISQTNTINTIPTYKLVWFIFPERAVSAWRNITFCLYIRVTLSGVFALTAQGCERPAEPRGQIDSDFPALVSRKRPAFYAGGKSDFNEFFQSTCLRTERRFRVHRYLYTFYMTNTIIHTPFNYNDIFDATISELRLFFMLIKYDVFIIRSFSYKFSFPNMSLFIFH